MDTAKSALARAAERFDIPGEALGQTRITITGERRLFIEKHRGILEYGRELISVNCGRKILAVYGTKLDLVSMTSEELLITGEITRIEFQ
ncbi:MAG: YabP/YqfC family sporulation protein [Oscillospiraceae bacterium]|nr:YabP/YqfC family sporulation protein [Oscillospiraceae bacterium]